MLNVQCTITTYIAIPKVKKEVYNEKLQLRKTKAKAFKNFYVLYACILSSKF